MYALKGHIGGRGFYLLDGHRRVFQTHHKFGILRRSWVFLHGERINIKSGNWLGDRCKIFKNGSNIGYLNFSHYLYSVISLDRKDGLTDKFKFEQEGYSQVYILSSSEEQILKVTTSLNPLLVDDKYQVEVLTSVYGKEEIEELIFYTGEILYRSEVPKS